MSSSSDRPRYYFDQAATSFPKPPGVAQAVYDYLQNLGAPAGRGQTRAAATVQQLVEHSRQLLAQLLHVAEPAQIIFTFNGTDALNTALWGLCRPGDHVISSTWEHNSVLRPLHALQRTRQVHITWLTPDQHGWIAPTALLQALTPQTKLIVLQHVSNVCGVIQPLEAWCEVLADHPAWLVIDGAQAVGHFPLSLSASRVDVYAASGHKGLGGPLGTGFLYLSPRVTPHLQPFRYGGTGLHSEELEQPSTLPTRFEAGNLNVPGIVGLRAALLFLQTQNLLTRWQHEQNLVKQLWQQLQQLPGVTLYGPDPHVVPRTGIISCNLSGYPPEETANLLEWIGGVEVRAGLHCAPGVHRSWGTIPLGGTVRLSLSAQHTAADLEHLIHTVRALLSPSTTM
ncbi:MAG: cysteine desulfurase [Planctomycetaceae bacterium]|nr:MAG: cysteine desulfurase [Planctomycetaceae bacterium]